MPIQWNGQGHEHLVSSQIKYDIFKEEHMAERKLKVYKGTTKDYDPIPRISLQGQWLEELGFSIGDKLTIICRQGEIVISKAACEHV